MDFEIPRNVTDLIFLACQILPILTSKSAQVQTCCNWYRNQQCTKPYKLVLLRRLHLKESSKLEDFIHMTQESEKLQNIGIQYALKMCYSRGPHNEGFVWKGRRDGWRFHPRTQELKQWQNIGIQYALTTQVCNSRVTRTKSFRLKGLEWRLKISSTGWRVEQWQNIGMQYVLWQLKSATRELSFEKATLENFINRQLEQHCMILRYLPTDGCFWNGQTIDTRR